ncbi:HAD family hydrolase [Kitasatospora sp. NPDC059973]|uniref:HAD family hydrolase n=1 Tax=Kitasatospora sp. NPDC059973 TaxID=3347020 RepID=UPI0036C7828E
MPLLMLDLDNTLIDRDAAFLASARAFLAEHGLPGSDLGWIAELDASGYTPEDRMAAALAARYGSSVPASAVDALLDNGGADLVELAAPTRRALARARADGWACVIVTNGRTGQQEAKIRRTGLDRIVQGWVVSEAVGHKKPAPEIFRAAAETVGQPLSGAWMVGDSAHADIAGAHALGLGSVWVSAGRSWAQDAYRPTLVAEDVATAIGHALDHACGGAAGGGGIGGR